MDLKALIFDCDGVLAETERDGHRVAYNKAMTEFGIADQWDTELYAKLVTISGGKERLKYFFDLDEKKFPREKFAPELVQKIYDRKTIIFKEMVETGLLPPRSGIARIIKEAHDNNVLLFVCSTSHLDSVTALVRKNFGGTYLSWFTELFCGDVVAKKKPTSDIYNLVKTKYELDPSLCCVVEDTRNGLLAAKGAGMNCIVTPSYYSSEEDFSEADLIVSNLGDPEGERSEIIRQSHNISDDGYISISDVNVLVK